MDNTTENRKLIPSREVRRLVGDISDMTLWRFLHHQDYAALDFPSPDAVICKRRYWYRETIAAWLQRQQEGA